MSFDGSHGVSERRRDSQGALPLNVPVPRKLLHISLLHDELATASFFQGSLQVTSYIKSCLGMDDYAVVAVLLLPMSSPCATPAFPRAFVNGSVPATSPAEHRHCLPREIRSKRLLGHRPLTAGMSRLPHRRANKPSSPPPVFSATLTNGSFWLRYYVDTYRRLGLTCRNWNEPARV